MDFLKLEFIQVLLVAFKAWPLPAVLIKGHISAMKGGNFLEALSDRIALNISTLNKHSS